MNDSGEINKITSYHRELYSKYDIFQVMVADHSQNITNINENVNESLSLVICFENDTKNKFKHHNEFHDEIVYDKEYFDNLNLDDEVDDDIYALEILNDIERYLPNV